MSQASQAKAMHEYFQSLLNDTEASESKPELPAMPLAAPIQQPEQVSLPVAETMLVSKERTEQLNQLLSAVAEIKEADEVVVEAEIAVASPAQEVITIAQLKN